MGGWTFIVAPGSMLVFECRSGQEWSLTKCKRLRSGHKYISSLSQDFAHVVHIVCAHCASHSHRTTFQVAFCQLIHMPASSAKPGFGTAAVGASYPGQHGCTAAQQCLTSVSASSNFRVMLKNDTLIAFTHHRHNI